MFVRAHEIREMNDQDLMKELEDSYKELLNLRFRVATKQLANVSQIKTTKKKIARLSTVARERRLEDQ
jgi:large subunit ribosomal protein L29